MTWLLCWHWSYYWQTGCCFRASTASKIGRNLMPLGVARDWSAGFDPVLSRTACLYNISCYVYKQSPYWSSGLASQRYVPRPLAPLKPLTLAVRQSHWLYVTVLHFSIWWWLSSPFPNTYRDGLPTHRWSPILVLTGSDVAQLRWSKPTCYH